MKKNGFTLIEIMFVLFVISMLALLFIPNIVTIVEKRQTEHFFAVLDSDILFIQNQTLGTQNIIFIMFQEDVYFIIEGRDIIERREYPNHLRYMTKSNNNIMFNNNGTLFNPTTFQFKDAHTTYKIVFPLGKGRHYIEKG